MQVTTDEPARPRIQQQRDRFGLWTKTALEHGVLGSWEERAYKSFVTRVLDPRFPCFFAAKAQREGQLLYGFADSTEHPTDLLKIYVSLLGYLELVDHLTGMEKIMATLILFIKPVTNRSVEEYVQQAWGVMQFLHDYDTTEWPPEVPGNPDQPSWSFCFDGTPLFVNISTPAHQDRKSRNLGEALTLVIQPRDGFDVVAGDTPSGRQVRNTIRNRIVAHDRIPPSPELGQYRDEEKREWRQYGLRDTNDPALGACPFRKKGISDV